MTRFCSIKYVPGFTKPTTKLLVITPQAPKVHLFILITTNFMLKATYLPTDLNRSLQYPHWALALFMSRMSQLSFSKVPGTSFFLSRSLFLCYFWCAEISCLYFQVAVVSAFQNLFGAHGRYFPACPLFCF